MPKRLEEQKTELEAQRKDAEKAVKAIEKSKEYSTTKRALEDAQDAHRKARNALDEAHTAHLRRMLGLPKRAGWKTVHNALARQAGLWAGFTEQDLKTTAAYHGETSLTHKAASTVRKAIFEAFPLTDKSLNAAIKRTDQAVDKARKAFQPHQSNQREAERKRSRLHWSLREVNEKITAREDRKARTAERNATPEKAKATAAHKESRKKLRELTGFSVDSFRARRLAEPHEASLKAFLKKELDL
jgi:predicted  nucleic acid-binding Zn-ribbon protein